MTEDELRDGRAKYAVFLALTFASWVHRRVETFEFVDSDTVRRRMSVDFTLPAPEGLDAGQTVYVPLMLLAKHTLHNLDVSDGAGRPLTVLTRDQGREVALRGLEFLLGESGEDSAPREELRAIVEAEPFEKEEGAAGGALAPDGEIMRCLAQLGEPLADQIKALLEDLERGFMLLVPIGFQNGARQLVKFSYDARFERAPLRKLLWWIRRIASSTGLLARTEVFSGLAVGWAQSYHAEVVPAASTYSAAAWLEVETVHGTLDPPPDTHPTRPHMRAKRSGDPNRGDVGTLRVFLHARRDGLVFPLLLSAAVITTVLAFFLPQQEGEIDSVTLGALLLAPFALATYYARSDENSYVTAAMRGVRLIATVPVIAGITVIGLLALGYLHSPDPNPSAVISPKAALDVARWGARAAAWSTAVLLMAMIGPTLGAWGRAVGNFLPSWTPRTMKVLCAGLIWVAVLAFVLAGLHRLLPI